MAEQVQITVSQAVYDRAQQLAAARNQPVDEVLAEALELVAANVESLNGDQKMAREEAAFAAMRDELLRQYEGEYVAIHHAKLIDHDADEVALLQRLDAEFPNEAILMKQVRAEPEPILKMRSPRLLPD